MTETFATRTSAQCDVTAVAQQSERMATRLRWTWGWSRTREAA